jgi:glycine/D-amino acid oxidase-like deaminating enzyme
LILFSFVMAVCASDPIIIVGAGALGLSAALHLSQRGYTNISVFEQNDIPSGNLRNVLYPWNSTCGFGEINC